MLNRETLAFLLQSAGLVVQKTFFQITLKLIACLPPVTVPFRAAGVAVRLISCVAEPPL